MREMRFGLRVMGIRSLGDELLQVPGDLFHQGFELAGSSRAGQQPAADFFLDLLDRLGTVDSVGGVGVEVGIRRDIGGQGIEVVEAQLGPKVLIGGVPGQAGSVLEAEAMLDPFESLLNSPARMIEPRESGSGKSDRIQ